MHTTLTAYEIEILQHLAAIKSLPEDYGSEAGQDENGDWIEDANH